MADFAISSHIYVQAQLNRITSLSPGRDILGLERINALLQVMGNPHHHLPPIFHVAGTNGKGSTCAFLRSAIEASGKICHVYSSPHLVRFNERIRIAGQLISDDELAEILRETLDSAEMHDLNPSFFEITTAAAFLAFSRHPADACIIEVGLGGRLDATNIIENPTICAIANLGIDHEGFLLSPENGAPDDPMTRIAWEKAGIAKTNTPLVVGHYTPSMNNIIAEHAQHIGAPLYTQNVEWEYEVREDNLHYKDQKGAITLPLPSLKGSHQHSNAALAIAMLRHQSAVDVSEQALCRAMTDTRWPARLQRLSDGPLHRLQAKHEIWLDGGHNANAGKAIASHFDVNVQNNQYIHLIIGMLSNKDPASILAPMLGQIKSITVLPISGHDHHDIEAFKSIIINHDIAIKSVDTIQSALQSIDNIAPNDIIFIAGSLYLAGTVLAANEQYPD